jgi:hypothetical protein
MTADQLLDLGWMCAQREGFPDEWQHPVLGAAIFDFDTAVEATIRGQIRDTSNQDPDWKPTERDMAWQREHYAKLADDAVWKIPATGAVFRVYPSEKRVVLHQGDPEQGPNDRIIETTKAIGWTVEVREKTTMIVSALDHNLSWMGPVTVEAWDVDDCRDQAAVIFKEKHNYDITVETYSIAIAWVEDGELCMNVW